MGQESDAGLLMLQIWICWCPVLKLLRRFCQRTLATYRWLRTLSSTLLDLSYPLSTSMKSSQSTNFHCRRHHRAHSTSTNRRRYRRAQVTNYQCYCQQFSELWRPERPIMAWLKKMRECPLSSSRLRLKRWRRLVPNEEEITMIVMSEIAMHEITKSNDIPSTTAAIERKATELLTSNTRAMLHLNEFFVVS